MSMVITIKDRKTGKFILACDGLYHNGLCSHEKVSPRSYNIQKFKNFVVAYSGIPSLFQKVVTAFDFDSFPTPLTKSFIIRRFYPDLIKYLVDIKQANVSDKGIVQSFPFEIFFLTEDGVIDLFDNHVAASGVNMNMFADGDTDIAWKLYHCFYKEMDTLELLKLIMELTNDKYNTVGYPLMYTKQGDKYIHFINEDGSTYKEPLQELWRIK